MVPQHKLSRPSTSYNVSDVPKMGSRRGNLHNNNNSNFQALKGLHDIKAWKACIVFVETWMGLFSFFFGGDLRDFHHLYVWISDRPPPPLTTVFVVTFKHFDQSFCITNKVTKIWQKTENKWNVVREKGEGKEGFQENAKQKQRECKNGCKVNGDERRRWCHCLHLQSLVGPSPSPLCSCRRSGDDDDDETNDNAIQSLRRAQADWQR